MCIFGVRLVGLDGLFAAWFAIRNSACWWRVAEPNHIQEFTSLPFYRLF